MRMPSPAAASAACTAAAAVTPKEVAMPPRRPLCSEFFSATAVSEPGVRAITRAIIAKVRYASHSICAVSHRAAA